MAPLRRDIAKRLSAEKLRALFLEFQQKQQQEKKELNNGKASI